MDEERRIVILTDEDGKEWEFELLDYVDYQEKSYAIFTPYEEEIDEEDEEGDLAIVPMEAVMAEDGEMILNYVEDDALVNQILDTFLTQLLTQEEEG